MNKLYSKEYKQRIKLVGFHPMRILNKMLKRNWESIVGGPSDYSDYSGTIAGYPPSTGGKGGIKLGLQLDLLS